MQSGVPRDAMERKLRAAPLLQGMASHARPPPVHQSAECPAREPKAGATPEEAGEFNCASNEENGAQLNRALPACSLKFTTQGKAI
mmetsp:Transcript_28400/g.88548  ORF Transcript_28400/g.88548 Transcript_28400/m.88548 type:complete len:86 (-) Transcript_28400:2-259(-)